MKIHQKLNLRYYKKSAKIWRQIFFADYFFQCSKNILNFLCCLKSETNKNLEIIVQNIDNSGFFFTHSVKYIYLTGMKSTAMHLLQRRGKRKQKMLISRWLTLFQSQIFSWKLNTSSNRFSLDMSECFILKC